jgi:hypothetical protein
MARRFYVAAAISLAVLTSPIFAQQPPGFEKGFAPEKVFNFWNIDAVNTFNGNLSLSIPIGPSYPVNAGLSYQIGLSYNSKVWDYEQIAGVNRAVPSRRSNAGMGWLLSLGRMIPPNNPTNPGGGWAYESPDGHDHVLFGSLHNDDPSTVFSPPITSVGYTRDGSYIRMLQKNTGTIDLEFPDGTIKTFDSINGNLVVVRDRFSNFVRITYLPNISGTPCPSYDAFAWQITDSQSVRTNYVCFQPASYPESTYDGQIERVILAAPPDALGNARTATYMFGYTQMDVTRGCHSQLRNDTTTASVPMLTSIVQPDSSSFAFTYNLGATNSVCEQGTLSSVTLPTAGQINYAYRYYQIPTDNCGVGTWDSYVTGVGTRTVSGPRIATSQWSYTSTENLTPGFVYCENNFNVLILKRAPSEEMIVTATDPLGNATEHYYSVWPIPAGETIFDSSGNIIRDSSGNPITTSPNGFNMPEYGLPFTRMPGTSDNGRLLSRRVYTPSGYAASPRQPLRSFFTGYELDATTCTTFDFYCLTSNQRPNAERVVYHDDSSTSAATDYFDFDGLGHYRTATLGGSFASGNATTIAGYNKRDPNVNPSSGINSGSYPGSFALPTGSDAWILDRPSSVQHTEGGATSVAQMCYDAATGFLRARRTLIGGARNSSDLLSIFTSERRPIDGTDNGNVANEAYHGGDVRNNAPDSALCSIADSPPSAPEYQIAHTYSVGVQATSQYAGATFLSLNRSVDQYTGAILSETDSAGKTTTYNYEVPFRLHSVQLPGLAATTYTYVNASPPGTSFTPARIEAAATSTQGSGTVETHYQYDAVGRLWREKKRMPDGTFSLRETIYNSGGLVDSISGFETLVPNPTEYDFVPAHKTVYGNYDPFGRAGLITPPDTVSNFPHTTTFNYAGVRSMTRTVTVATLLNAETNAPTTETYDRQGRLSSVTERSGPSASDVMTNYQYDVGGRLASTSTTGSGATQVRVFTYDNRGFLAQEQHPELGTGGVQYIYTAPGGRIGYDSIGHVHGKLIGSINGLMDIRFDYDFAGRVTDVYDSGDTRRSVKHFLYAPSNDSPTSPTDFRQGKLWQAVRYNRPPSAPGAIVVTETYRYASPSGRVSQRDTLVQNVPTSGQPTTLQQFTQNFSYDDLGAVASLNYPTCAPGSPCNGANPSGVAFTHTSGFLTAIPGYASSITYNPNTTLHELIHGTNGGAYLKDTYEPDASGLPRPRSITFSGFQECSAPQAPTISAPNYVCSNSAGNAASVPNDSTLTYSWSISGGAITSSAANAAITFTAGASGNVIVTVTESNGCGSTSVSRTLPIQSTPTATVSGGGAINPGGSAQIQAALTGTAPWSVTWSDGVSQSGITVSPATRTVSPSVTTTYTVTAISDANCAGSSSGSATVTVNLNAPTGFSATTITGSSLNVSLQWSAVQGAGWYQVERATILGGVYSPVGSHVTGTSASDSFSPTPSPTTYLYRVRAGVTAGGVDTFSSPSAIDYATVATVLFSDDPIISGLTGVKGIHLGEVRAAIDAVRRAAGLAPAWASYGPSSGPITAADNIAARQRLDEAVIPLVGHGVAYGGETPASVGLIRSYQLQQIRDGVK